MPKKILSAQQHEQPIQIKDSDDHGRPESGYTGLFSRGGKLFLQDGTGKPKPLSVTLGAFRTEGSQIINPAGNVFYGAGMNAAINVTTDNPFVFEGADGNEVDIWPGLPNETAAVTYYPGGGINSYEKYSPVSTSNLNLPDRYYAMNGTLTNGAAAFGVVQPADNWAQTMVRVPLNSEGAGSVPSTETLLPEVKAALTEVVNVGGLIAMPVLFDLGDADTSPTGNWNDPPASFTGTWERVITMYDGIVEEFGIDGSGGETNVDKGYVWFNPLDKPYTTGATTAYLDMCKFWIERIRNYHGVENIIALDLPDYGQGLGRVVDGDFDTWWTDLQNHSSGDLTRNLVLSWHAFGYNTVTAADYTYADMDSHINTVLNTKGYPLVIGRYGQLAQSGLTAPFGTDSANRAAVQHLMTDNNGQALAKKYNVNPCVWSATGDSATVKRYKLVQGATAATDDNLGIPFWDIEDGADALLEELGTVHWDVSHYIRDLNVANSVDLPAGGNDGQVLAKTSEANGVVAWIDGAHINQTGTGTGRTIHVQLAGEAAPTNLQIGDVVIEEVV